MHENKTYQELQQEVKQLKKELAYYKSKAAENDFKFKNSTVWRKGYFHLLEELPLGVFICDKRGNLIEINNELVKIIGAPDKKSVRKLNLFHFHNLIKFGISEKLQRVLSIKQHVSFETPYKSSWGKEIYAKIYVSPLFSSINNDLQGLMGIVDETTGRIEVLRKMRQSEQQNRLILESINTPVLYFDKSLCLQKFNNTTLRYLNKNKVDLAEKKLHEFLPGQMAAVAENRLIKVLHSGKTENYQDKVQLPIGRKWIRTQIDPVFINNELRGVQLIAHDISDLKQTEHQLFETRNYLESILANTPSGIFSTDKEGKIKLWNNRAEEITGYSREEVVGKDCDFFACKECIDNCLLKNNKKDKEASTIECQILTKQNNKIYISKNTDLLQDTNGKVMGIVESFEDITVRVLADKKLEKSQYQLKNAQRIAKIGSFENNITNKENIFSDELIRILGLSNHDKLDYNRFISMIHPEDVKAYISFFNKILKNPVTDKSEHEFRFLRPDKQLVYLRASIECSVDKQGNVTKVQGILQDITETKKINKQLEQNLIHQEFLTKLSYNFIKNQNFEQGLLKMLSELAEISKAEKVVVQGNFIYEKHQSSYYEWINPNNKKSYKSLDYAGYQSWAIDFLKKHQLIHSEKPELIPDEINQQLPQCDTQSFLILPLYFSNHLQGFLSFEIFAGKRKWTESQIAFLNLAGSIISFAYERYARFLEIKESELKFRTIFNNSSEMIFITNLNNQFIDINKTVEKRLGYKREEFQELTPNKISVILKSSELSDHLSLIRGSQQLIFGSHMKTKSEKLIPVSVNSQLIDYNNQKVILSIASDLTEEEDFRKRMLNTIIATEEKERKRFAQDLHDGLGPLLSSAKMYINMLDMDNFTDEQKEMYIKQASSIIDESISTASRIANNIMPNVLQDFGLISAVDSFIERINLLDSTQFSLTYNVNNRILENIELVLFRIIKELINNTLKHSNAKSGKIDLVVNESKKIIRLKYKDDGCGFDEQPEKLGNGMINIRNRVNSLNGQCNIQGKVNKGIMVEIEIPLVPPKSLQQINNF